MTAKIRDEISRRNEKMTDEEVYSLIEDIVLAESRDELQNIHESASTIRRIFYTIRKDLDVLQPYLEDETVSEIMVNGISDIFVERNGEIIRVFETFESTEELEEIIRRIAARVHRDINELNPIVDARLPDGSRINAVYKNIALNGPILTVRKFPRQAITMEQLVRWKTVTREAAEFLERLVYCRYNIFISGGTSSGKTTFLNVLSNYIPATQRVIVIEDSAELQINQIDNIIRMECKNANLQGKGEVKMDQLIKTSLRMRPDRIIVGEVRGKEVMDMIQAMNTGHDGSLSTGHGNSVEGMLRRLESMFLLAANFPIDAIRSQIGEALDIIVHLGKLPDNKRQVLEIAEIAGINDGYFKINSLFAHAPDRGLVRTKNDLINQEKLYLNGRGTHDDIQEI